MDIIPALLDGERKELLHSPEIIDQCLANPDLIDEVIEAVDYPHLLVEMRALDILEKVARKDKSLLNEKKSVFLKDYSKAELWETRLQVVRALGLFEWGRDLQKVVNLVRKYLQDENKLVYSWASDTFALLSLQDERLKEEAVERTLKNLGDERKSVAARARNTCKTLGLKP